MKIKTNARELEAYFERLENDVVLGKFLDKTRQSQESKDLLDESRRSSELVELLERGEH
jgi:alkyl hydroperoxide reductase subunit AhpF